MCSDGFFSIWSPWIKDLHSLLVLGNTQKSSWWKRIVLIHLLGGEFEANFNEEEPRQGCLLVLLIVRVLWCLGCGGISLQGCKLWIGSEEGLLWHKM